METFHGLNLGAGVQSTTLELMFRKGLVSYDGQPVKLTAAGFADTRREPGYVYRHLQWLMDSSPQGSGPSPHPIWVASRSDIGADLMSDGQNGLKRVACIPAFTAAAEGKRDGIVRRQCTSDYKIEVLNRLWKTSVLCMKPRQRVPETKKLFLYYGISLDEKSRATSIWEAYHVGRPRKNKDGTLKCGKDGAPLMRRTPFEPRFPLISLGMTRHDCEVFLSAQHIPHKVRRSACVFCPFHSDAEWLDLQRYDPEGWAYSVEMDKALRTPGRIVNRKMNQKLYLHSSCVPLDLVQLDTTPAAPKLIQQGLWQNECAGMCGM